MKKPQAWGAAAFCGEATLWPGAEEKEPDRAQFTIRWNGQT